MINLHEEYEVHTTFNVSNLWPFIVGVNDEAKSIYLRTNPLQERGDDRRILRKGPTTRTMAKRIKEE